MGLLLRYMGHARRRATSNFLQARRWVERRRFAKVGLRTTKETTKGRHAHTVPVSHACGCRTSCVLCDRDDVGQQGCDDGASNVKVKKALDRRGFGMEGIPDPEVTIKVMYQMGYCIPGDHDLYGKLRQKARSPVSWAQARWIDVRYEMYGGGL